MRIQFPEKAIPILYGKARYKVLHGGRAGTKSWDVARYLLIDTAFKNQRILCTREMQNSIKDSVYRLLLDQIKELKLDRYFEIKADSFIGRYSRSEFIFKGLHHNISEIKSLEGIDKCWVEEANKVCKDSWDVLIPTIRKDNSEIIVTFNPDEEKDATYQKFIVNTPPDCLITEINYYDNPWFPEVLRREMEYDKRVDYEKYEHVWLGKTKKYSSALIIPPQKIRIEAFDTPEDAHLLFGADFGFSNDPAVLGRMFISERKLYIDYEAYGIGIETEDLPTFYDSVPESRKWKIIADSERPDTISFLKRKGFNIVGAEKGKGSVEDGIGFLRSFEEIIIHPRCRGAKDNFQNYKWKVDRITGDILPIPADGSDHWPDTARYALEPYMKAKEAYVGQQAEGYNPYPD